MGPVLYLIIHLGGEQEYGEMFLSLLRNNEMARLETKNLILIQLMCLSTGTTTTPPQHVIDQCMGLHSSACGPLQH